MLGHDYTVCPRRSEPFYILSYCIKWVTTSWTYSICFHIGCWVSMYDKKSAAVRFDPFKHVIKNPYTVCPKSVVNFYEVTVSIRT